MNTFLSSIMQKFNGGDVDPEVVDEQAKIDRIAYHRAHVKNGPVSYKASTSPTRRARLDQKAQRRKAQKRHVKRFHGQEMTAARLRGRLQAANALPYADENFRPSLELRTNALLGLVGEFGAKPEPAELTNEYIEDAVAGAVATYETLSVR